MESRPSRNHDHLDWNTVKQCKAVRDLSRFTPDSKGDDESLEELLSRVDTVTEGIGNVMRRPRTAFTEG